MIAITETLSIPDEELSYTFSRSGGPGGQNVNKVASKVQLRWEIAVNITIPPFAKERLTKLHPSKVTIDGGFLIVAQESRDQIRNKEIVLEKLIDLIRKAVIVPKARRKTKPSYSSHLRRLADKKATSKKKSNRQTSSDD
jgi:ribosome-associated protein